MEPRQKLSHWNSMAMATSGRGYEGSDGPDSQSEARATPATASERENDASVWSHWRYPGSMAAKPPSVKVAFKPVQAVNVSPAAPKPNPSPIIHVSMRPIRRALGRPCRSFTVPQAGGEV